MHELDKCVDQNESIRNILDRKSKLDYLLERVKTQITRNTEPNELYFLETPKIQLRL